MVILATQNGVDDECFEPGVPQSTSFGRSRIDICCRKGDFAGIVQYAFAELVWRIVEVILDDFDGDLNQLKSLLETHRAQEFARCDTKNIGGNPGCCLRRVIPTNERGDTGLRHHAHGGASARRHVFVPGEIALEPRQSGARHVSRNIAQPGQRLLLGHGLAHGVLPGGMASP